MAEDSARRGNSILKHANNNGTLRLFNDDDESTYIKLLYQRQISTVNMTSCTYSPCRHINGSGEIGLFNHRLFKA